LSDEEVVVPAIMLPRVRRSSRCRSLAGLLLLGGGLLACGDPNITSLDPPTGPRRTLVRVNGSTLFATAFWDAGAASEVAVPGAFLGASIFSVPGGAGNGAHTVQLQRGSQRGTSAIFAVTAPTPFAAPRLDRVSLAGAQFQTGNQVSVWMLVQGANVDVGAEVLVDGVVQPTAAVKALRNALFGVAPGTLGNPLYHHLALIAAPGPRATGSAITVTIRNLDGLTSNAIVYTLPVNAATMDSDGDDIPDEWERNGYDADGDGTIDIDLPALGADPRRPDVLLEVDIMQGLTNPPAAAAFQAMQNAYAAAPYINLTTDDGINLILDTSGSVPFSQTIDMTGADNPAAGFTNFYTLKNANFDNANRGRLYYYCIWANARPNGSSGVSDPTTNAAGTDFNGPGDDCIVSFDDFSAAFQTARSGAETLMHEVGHNFQQRHGGATHFTGNPTYNSVMSYSWQLRTGRNNATRVSRPVCVPFYYGQTGAVETNGALPATVGTVIDYSDGMGANLNEAALNEPAGVCNSVPVDWNGNGAATGASVAVDISGNGVSTDVWTDFSNWAALVFGGPRLNGANGT
jgi:hypothetical protein